MGGARGLCQGETDGLGPNQAGLLGQDMMSKFGDSVWWYPIEVAEGIKDDESNSACPSFSPPANLQTGRETHCRAKFFIYICCAIYILGIRGIRQKPEWKADE